MALPWYAWMSLMGNLYHYGTHQEVKDFWKERGEEFGEALEKRKEAETSPFPDFDPVTGMSYGYQTKGPSGQIGPPAPQVKVKPKKRQVSKSNKAMSGLYKFLAKQQKGKMTQAKCRKLLSRCSKIIGKANPTTKSRIGKGSSKNQKLARKMRKQYWGTTKRI
jgi:hypothetical protein